MLTAFRYTLLIAILALASSVAGDTLTIDAPDLVEAGEMMVIPIHGADNEWNHELAVFHFPTEGATCVVGRALTPDAPPRIIFHATLPGQYMLAVATKDADGKLVTAKVVLKVGGEPEPQPNPIPVPPVPIPGERNYVVIYETENIPVKRSLMIATVRAYMKKSLAPGRWGVVDKDLKDGLTDRPSKWLSKYLSSEKMKQSGLKVPVLMVSVTNGQAFSVVAVESLDGLSGAEAVALVKKWGG